MQWPHRFFACFPLLPNEAVANKLHSCDEAHFVRHACFRNWHEFVADSIHSSRCRMTGANLVRNLPQTKRSKLLVVSLCRCRDADRAIHCFYRLFMRSFITPAFPFIFMHAAPSIHSFNHSFTSAAIYFIHTFIFSLISLSYTITVYCFVGCRDQNRHPHSPLPSSLTSQSILVIENNCCGHPIFGQGSIP